MNWAATPEYTDVPENLRDLVKEKRAEMVERIAELDDDLTLKYLEGEELSIEELKAALRKGVLHNEVSPVFAGSSLKNKGVQPLLDAVVDYLPSPLDMPDVIGHHTKTDEEVTRSP